MMTVLVGAVLTLSVGVFVAAPAALEACDLTHRAFVSDLGVPGFWPEFCLTYDVTATAHSARLLRSRRVRASA